VTSETKSSKKKSIIIVIIASITIGSILSISLVTFDLSSYDDSSIEPEIVPTDDSSIEPEIVPTDVYSLFKTYSYADDYDFVDGKKLWRNSFYELDENNLAIYDELMNKKNSAVVLPLFTSVAYSEPGFYTYFRGECNENCLTIEFSDSFDFGFTSSGSAVQIFDLLGYELITDIHVHQNPNILSSYEKIILLHNEYVTSVEFDAIISHPNVVYLYPNALYAEIDFDEESWMISLIRGHNYPETSIINGFDWEFDNSPDEYDTTCTEMEFSRIDNGWMLNCYPENILHKSKELLKQINDF